MIPHRIPNRSCGVRILDQTLARSNGSSRNAPVPSKAPGRSGFWRGQRSARLSCRFGCPIGRFGRYPLEPLLTSIGTEEYPAGDAERDTQQEQADEDPKPEPSFSLGRRAQTGHSPVVFRAICSGFTGFWYRGRALRLRTLGEGARFLAQACSAIATEQVVVFVFLPTLPTPFHMVLFSWNGRTVTREVCAL